jgi:hypothetical protein
LRRSRRVKALPGPDGSDTVKRILGSVSGIAIGLAELPNRGLRHRTRSGPAQAPSGLGARHAHLAVSAAFTWCQLMLDTLSDPKSALAQGSSTSAIATCRTSHTASSISSSSAGLSDTDSQDGRTSQNKSQRCPGHRRVQPDRTVDMASTRLLAPRGWSMLDGLLSKPNARRSVKNNRRGLLTPPVWRTRRPGHRQHGYI